jgi:hypothetical protein
VALTLDNLANLYFAEARYAQGQRTKKPGTAMTNEG